MSSPEFKQPFPPLIDIFLRPTDTPNWDKYFRAHRAQAYNSMVAELTRNQAFNAFETLKWDFVNEGIQKEMYISNIDPYYVYRSVDLWSLLGYVGGRNGVHKEAWPAILEKTIQDLYFNPNSSLEQREVYIRRVYEEGTKIGKPVPAAFYKAFKEDTDNFHV